MYIFLELISLLLTIVLVRNLMYCYKPAKHEDTCEEKKRRLPIWVIVFAFILLLTPCFLLAVDFSQLVLSIIVF